MKLFHGSNMNIEKIDLQKSKPSKDFGRDFDIVYGPIANDRVGRQIMNLKEGYISFEEFMQRLQFMKGITFQYAFCTEKAISKLKKI